MSDFERLKEMFNRCSNEFEVKHRNHIVELCMYSTGFGPNINFYFDSKDGSLYDVVGEEPDD